MAEAINTLLAPMRQRRAQYEGDDDTIMDILRSGCRRANDVGEKTLAGAKEAASLRYFARELALK